MLVDDIHIQFQNNNEYPSQYKLLDCYVSS